MRVLLFSLIGTVIALSSNTADSREPVTPTASIPRLQDTKIETLCIGCENKFSLPDHLKLLASLDRNPYVGELRKALYWQDTVHQFQSKAHFDNCDFDGSIDYLRALLDEVDGHVLAAAQAKASSDEHGAEAAVRSAFFSLGQALHGVQDFYAHTNYVELQVANVTNVSDIAIISPWRDSDRDQIAQLQKAGLISGFVSWGFPKKCAAGVLSHGELAKDSADTARGKITVPHLQNTSMYAIAQALATRASRDLMSHAFRRWPLLLNTNGNYVAFEVLVDRREP